MNGNGTGGAKPRARRRAVVDISLCAACGACEAICPRGAIAVWRGSYARVDESRCVGCGMCARECPASTVRVEAVA